MNKTFIYNKLVRDRSPEMVARSNGTYATKPLDDAAFAQEVRAKLVEELDELFVAANADELCDEIGDVYELLEEYAKLHGLTQERIRLEQAAKRERRGGFAGRLYMESVTVPDDSEVAAYCRRQPDKYKELE